MQLIHVHHEKQVRLRLDNAHVIIDMEQFLKAQQMEQAMLTFIKLNDAGEIQSMKTYKSFKAILGL